MAKTENSIVPEFNIRDYARLDSAYLHEPEEIAALYKRTYNIQQKDILIQTSYPYPEALDPEWIHKTIQDPNVGWKLVIDKMTDKIIGSGTVILNPENQRGYVRGVMIDPDYQGYGLSSYILVSAFKEFIQEHRDKIKIFWTENRTAHIKSQKISESSGMRPVGLLPNKDFFLEKRETDLIYILYAMNTLKSKRSDLKLIPEVLPIFELIRHQFRLDPVEAVQTSEINVNGYDVKGNITTDKYNYFYCTFRANGKKLKFMINPRTQVAENMWFSPDIDPITLKSLLRFAIHSLRPDLFYIECYVSAYQPNIQRVFVDLNFKPTGYIPGWNLVNGRREDVVIMTWAKEVPSLTDLRLTKRAKRIANLILS